MQTRESFLSRRFFDDQHYPYGFSRSGDFTIAEVDCLEQNGNLFRALMAGLVQNTTEEDEQFIRVVRGEVEAETLAEKTWIKYLKRSNRAPVWLTTRRIVEDDSEFDVSDDDLDDTFDEALEA
ncbi:DUF413 domain-containing protein [Pleionea sediminis]|uniref:DUF413 domain-containing protein n=1 Tax=Pleionea sediminis TaxID=2569479 RepID=UPI0011846EBF|nr:DUF413 domain-containing protein [Pleionea sediminis]